MWRELLAEEATRRSAPAELTRPSQTHERDFTHLVLPCSMPATAAQVPQRLINVHTLELEECSLNSPPGYAILSHTWGQEELSFQIWNTSDHGRHLHGYRKIEGACRIASEEFHLDYLWADTCCIDKSSSAELTEAINAMFQYYKNAHTCLIYLEDVPDVHPVESSGYQGDLMMDSLCSSRWFSRGWQVTALLPDRNGRTRLMPTGLFKSL